MKNTTRERKIYESGSIVLSISEYQSLPLSISSSLVLSRLTRKDVFYSSYFAYISSKLRNIAEIKELAMAKHLGMSIVTQLQFFLLFWISSFSPLTSSLIGHNLNSSFSREKHFIEVLVEMESLDLCSTSIYEVINDSLKKSNSPIKVIYSRSCIKSGELIRLAAMNCNSKIQWTLPNGLEKAGKSLDANIVGIYYAFCIDENETVTSQEKVIIEKCPENYPDIDITCTTFSQTRPLFVSAKCQSMESSIWINPLGKSDTVNFKEIYLVKMPGKYHLKCKQQDLSHTITFEQEESSFSIKAKNYLLDSTRRTILTSSGCYNGTVTWKMDSIVQYTHALNVKGPGVYEASCQKDNFIDESTKILQILPKESLVPHLGPFTTFVCPKERVNLKANCLNMDFYVQWRSIIQNPLIPGPPSEIEYEYKTGNSMTTIGPGKHWARCIKKDSSYLGNFDLTPIIIESAFPENFKPLNSSLKKETSCLEIGEKISLGIPRQQNSEYKWYNPAGLMISNQSNFDIKTDQNQLVGNYKLEVIKRTRNSSCTYYDSTHVSFTLKPIINSLSSNNPVKIYSPLNIKLDASNFSSTEWSGPNGFRSNRNEPNIHASDNTMEGLYSLLLNNEWGCKTRAEISLNIEGCSAKIKAKDPFTQSWEDNINVDRNGRLIPLTLYIKGNENDSLFRDYEIDWIDENGTIISRKPSFSIEESGSYYVKLSKGGFICRDAISISQKNPYFFHFATKDSFEFPDKSEANTLSFNMEEYLSPIFYSKNGTEYFSNLSFSAKHNKLIQYTFQNNLEREHLQIVPALEYSLLNSSPNANDFTGMVVRRSAENHFKVLAIEKYVNGQFIENLSYGQTEFDDSTSVTIPQTKDFRLSQTESYALMESFNCSSGYYMNRENKHTNWLCDYFEKLKQKNRDRVFIPQQSSIPYYDYNKKKIEPDTGAVIQLELISTDNSENQLVKIPLSFFMNEVSLEKQSPEELLLRAIETTFINAEKTIVIDNCNQLELLLKLTQNLLSQRLSKWLKIELAENFNKELEFENYLKLKNESTNSKGIEEWLKRIFIVKMKDSK